MMFHDPLQETCILQQYRSRKSTKIPAHSLKLW
jgi:hypothetical protein